MSMKMKPPQTPMAERIQKRMEELEISQNKLALLTDITQPSISGITSGITKNPSKIIEIARALRTYPDWIKYGTGPKEIGQEIPNSDIGDAQLAPPRLLSSVRTLPILGRAEGGDGVMILDVEQPPIGHVFCPQSLEQVTGAFAVYIVGDSMVPAARPGYVAYVHPHRSPERDGLVLVVKNDNRALVKTFVKRTDKALHLTQLNPSGPVVVPAVEVKNVYRIVGIWEG